MACLMVLFVLHTVLNLVGAVSGCSPRLAGLRLVVDIHDFQASILVACRVIQGREKKMNEHQKLS